MFLTNCLSSVSVFLTSSAISLESYWSLPSTSGLPLFYPSSKRSALPSTARKTWLKLAWSAFWSMALITLYKSARSAFWASSSSFSGLFTLRCRACATDCLLALSLSCSSSATNLFSMCYSSLVSSDAPTELLTTALWSSFPSKSRTVSSTLRESLRISSSKFSCCGL